MSNESKKDTNFIRIELTPDQQEQIRSEVGKSADAIELTTQELEERVAPRRMIE